MVEICEVGDIEELERGALVCGYGVGQGKALGVWDGGMCGVLDYGAELREAGLCEELYGNADRGAWHRSWHLEGSGGIDSKMSKEGGMVVVLVQLVNVNAR
jgi:hypothetical protein